MPFQRGTTFCSYPRRAPAFAGPPSIRLLNLLVTPQAHPNTKTLQVADWTFPLEQINATEICVRAGFAQCPTPEAEAKVRQTLSSSGPCVVNASRHRIPSARSLRLTILVPLTTYCLNRCESCSRLQCLVLEYFVCRRCKRGQGDEGARVPAWLRLRLGI